MQQALDAEAPGQFHVTLGLKHAEPKVEAAVDQLAAEGYTRIVGLVLAPHYSSFSIGQYHDRAGAQAAVHGISFTGIDSWATETAFVDFVAADLRAKFMGLAQEVLDAAGAESLWNMLTGVEQAKDLNPLFRVLGTRPKA